MTPRSSRVLLLALSGVRAADPELLALGLTLPGFAERVGEIAKLPSLGLLTLAAWTPPRFDVGYREIDAIAPDEADALAAEGWELVAISALTARAPEAHALADELRSRGLTVVLGGLHASALPEEALEHADAVVIGEAEAAWPGLLRDWERDELRRTYRATPDEAAAAWSSSRVPRYDLVPAGRHDRLTVQTMRGCPLDCSFCGASRTIAPFRRKATADVAREFETLAAVAPHHRLELADDNTLADRRAGRAVVDLLASHGRPWFTETDLSAADDPALLDALAASGCAGLLVGLESASRAVLAGIDSRGVKARWSVRASERVAAIHERGIPVTGCFVVGFDEDGPDVFERTHEAATSMPLAHVQVTVLTPFPGTPLFARLRRQGRLPPRPAWERFTLFDPVHEPLGMSSSELSRGLRELITALHSEEENERRRRRTLQARRAGAAVRGRTT